MYSATLITMVLTVFATLAAAKRNGNPGPTCGAPFCAAAMGGSLIRPTAAVDVEAQAPAATVAATLEGAAGRK